MPAADRYEFKNQSTTVIGVVKLNAKGEPEGQPLGPGRSIVLSKQEAELTAEAPANPKDNPFIARKVVRLDPETDEETIDELPAPLVPVEELDAARVTTRPVPAFGIDGPDPYEAEIKAQRARAAAAAEEADAKPAEDSPDAAALEEQRQELARERQAAEQEREALARERQELERTRAADAEVESARGREREAAQRASETAAEQRRVAEQAGSVVAPSTVPSPADAAGDEEDGDGEDALIHGSLKVSDYEAATPDQIAGFVKHADREYAEAVLAYEREHENRDEVAAAAQSRIEALAQPPQTPPPAATQPPRAPGQA